VAASSRGSNLTFDNGAAISLAGLPTGVANMGIRPEKISVSKTGKGRIDGEVEVMEHLGADSFAYIRVEKVGLFTVRIVGHSDLSVADKVALNFLDEDIYLFGEDAMRI
ncbi:MAG TPA: TOBE domain-containing protein, partial [Devosia sp.]|nr:TOBE domain-containing protein [Devosia sp.]